MYGYRTKHKILTKYLEKLREGVPEGQDLDIKHTVLMKEFAREIGKKEPRSGYVMQQMSNLAIEGYMHVTQNKEKNDMNISITGLGINAVMADFFKIKQHDLFWKALMNTIMTVANVAVAVTAVWALTKDNGELQGIEERLHKIEKEQQVKQVITNPSTVDSQNSHQTTPINPVGTAPDTTRN